MITTPYEMVTGRYKLPFPLWDLQAGAVNGLAPLVRGGYYAEVGTGKTVMSTVDALYQQMTQLADCHLVLVPPILITAWARWLRSIEGVEVVEYRGEPKARKLISIAGAKFVVMSVHIFKRDYAHVLDLFKDVNVGVILDEATCAKNIESATYKRVRDFSVGRTLRLLTGTPCATPGDAYAYIKLISPDVYRNKRVFDSIHVGETDFFGTIKSWNNLDLLKKNMEIGTVRLLKSEVLPLLPRPVYSVLHYDLHPEHQELYNRLVEEQVLELESGGKIDATSVAKLFTCSQQIILNWDHFSGDPTKASAGFDLLDEVLEELLPADRKLVIFANYRMTMRALQKHLAHLKPKVINGDFTPVMKERAVREFIENPDCRVIQIQPQSGGFGLDGLQGVCSDAIFLEEPTSPIFFEQCVGRLFRAGQTLATQVRLAVAVKTIQVRLHNLLLKNDELATYVQGGWETLREALIGGE